MVIKTMKRMKKISTFIAFVAAAALCACNNDNDNQAVWRVPQPAVESLYGMFPEAQNVGWYTSGNYVVAKFRTPQSGGAVQNRWAWFDGAGTWYMTETDMVLAQMPQAVQASFGASDYASWTFLDGDRLERAGLTDIYVIEVDGTGNNRGTSVALYFTAGGTGVKTVFNPSRNYHYSDMVPALLPAEVSAFVQSHYPAAQLIGSYFGNRLSRVEILDEGVARTLWFDGDNDWLYTVTQTEPAELPETVATALNESDYAAYTVSGTYYYNTPDGDFYRLVLTQGSRSVEVDITPEGSLTVVGQ